MVNFPVMWHTLLNFTDRTIGEHLYMVRPKVSCHLGLRGLSSRCRHMLFNSLFPASGLLSTSAGLSPCRLWPHGALVGWGQGLLHHLFCHRDSLHPPVPDGRGPACHCACHPQTRPLLPHSLGLLQAGGGHRPCRPAGVCHCVLLLLHPGCRVLRPGGRLELPGVFLFLLHFPQHHRPGGLCAWRRLQSEVQRTLQDWDHM